MRNHHCLFPFLPLCVLLCFIHHKKKKILVITLDVMHVFLVVINTHKYHSINKAYHITHGYQSRSSCGEYTDISILLTFDATIAVIVTWYFYNKNRNTYIIIWQKINWNKLEKNYKKNVPQLPWQDAKSLFRFVTTAKSTKFQKKKKKKSYSYTTVLAWNFACCRFIDVSKQKSLDNECIYELDRFVQETLSS